MKNYQVGDQKYVSCKEVLNNRGGVKSTNSDTYKKKITGKIPRFVN